MRKEQEDIALAETRLRTLVLRLPDFYGPHADESMSIRIFRAAVEGKTADWLGSADLPHEFVYMPDVARIVAELLLRDDLDGSAWNYGGPGTITGREFITAVYRAAGAQPKWRSVGRTMLRIAGVFSPLMRELVEMQYLYETPVILDDRRLMARLGNPEKTSYQQGIEDTVRFLRGG
jgi:nucleoside-diphosphate-sugar epimerase